MTAWETFTQGRYWARKNKKLWFLLWLPTALLALVGTLPMFNVLNEELSHSLMTHDMGDGFNLDFVSGFIFKYTDAAPLYWGLLVALGVLTVVISLWMTGGTLSVLASDDRRYKSALFFKGCGGYFWKFFRLFIVAAIFYALFVFGLNALLEFGVKRLTRDWTQEKYVLFINWGRLLVAAFLFMVVNMVFDYAKVRLVVEQGRSALAATFRALQFVFKHLSLTLRVFLLCALLGLLIVALYNPLEHILPQNTKRWVILVFLLQQCFILARMYVRLTFFSSEILLYESLRPSAPAILAASAAPAGFTNEKTDSISELQSDPSGEATSLSSS